MRAFSHRRFRRALSRYADGELDASAAQALALHLVECDRCSREFAMVRAIKGSLQRVADAEPPTLAATRLQRWASNPQGIHEVASLEPRDRVCVAMGTTPHPPPGVRRLVGQASQHRFRMRVGALVGVVAAMAAAGALLVHRQGPSPDLGTVTALVELARLKPPAAPVAGNGELAGQRPGRMLELGSRTVSLVRHLVDGREVLVATSDRPFSMPDDARRLGREQDAPWLAKRGDIGLACLSRPSHMLVVGPLPAERLVELGRQFEDALRDLTDG
ncbi:MAG TPA: anti-sigma factor [Acidimicrobiia bacterium]|jgi:anti-sigma factor RsiW|nr:anti-sigma factor [Acidimicrobiia bacterium]